MRKGIRETVLENKNLNLMFYLNIQTREQGRFWK